MNILKIIAVPMHKEGRKFVTIFAILTILLGFIYTPLFWIGSGLTVWCYYFFRDPNRIIPQHKNLIVSPADGVVSHITKLVPPADMQLGDTPRICVSIFMNVFNCHINRAPIGGKIRTIKYHKGKFINASLDKASEYNERNALTIEHNKDIDIGVIQIAGLVARRIVCFSNIGDTLITGERFGLIRFGSRLDIFLPVGTKPTVALGQTAIAGETILANLDNPNKDWQGKEI